MANRNNFPIGWEKDRHWIALALRSISGILRDAVHWHILNSTFISDRGVSSMTKIKKLSYHSRETGSDRSRIFRLGICLFLFLIIGEKAFLEFESGDTDAALGLVVAMIGLSIYFASLAARMMVEQNTPLGLSGSFKIAGGMLLLFFCPISPLAICLTSAMLLGSVLLWKRSAYRGKKGEQFKEEVPNVLGTQENKEKTVGHVESLRALRVLSLFSVVTLVFILMHLEQPAIKFKKLIHAVHYGLGPVKYTSFDDFIHDPPEPGEAFELETKTTSGYHACESNPYGMRAKYNCEFIGDHLEFKIMLDKEQTDAEQFAKNTDAILNTNIENYQYADVCKEVYSMGTCTALSEELRKKSLTPKLLQLFYDKSINQFDIKTNNRISDLLIAGSENLLKHGARRLAIIDGDQMNYLSSSVLQSVGIPENRWRYYLKEQFIGTFDYSINRTFFAFNQFGGQAENLIHVKNDFEYVSNKLEKNLRPQKINLKGFLEAFNDQEIVVNATGIPSKLAVKQIVSAAVSLALALGVFFALYYKKRKMQPSGFEEEVGKAFKTGKDL